MEILSMALKGKEKPSNKAKTKKYKHKTMFDS
jgi:hypothetical protein